MHKPTEEPLGLFQHVISEKIVKAAGEKLKSNEPKKE